MRAPREIRNAFMVATVEERGRFLHAWTVEAAQRRERLYNLLDAGVDANTRAQAVWRSRVSALTAQSGALCERSRPPARVD